MTTKQPKFVQHPQPVAIVPRQCDVILNAHVSCGPPELAGAMPGDLLRVNAEPLGRFLVFTKPDGVNPLAHLAPNQPWPFGGDLPSQHEIPDFTKPPAQPQKLPAKVRVRVLRNDHVIGHGITNPAIGSSHKIPLGAALELKSLGVIEIVEDLPAPEITMSVIRADPPQPGVDTSAESFRAGIDRRLRK